ncbi:MAG: hypothetical protein GY906_11240 [bacterium]|nr:hypothetical protein [bacterium]
MRHMGIRAMVLALLITAVCAVDAEAQRSYRPGDNGTARLRFGLFEPNADSRYWDDKFADFTGKPSDFRDFFMGFDYIWRLNSTSGIVFGLGFYEGKASQAYKDWTDAGGRDVSHRTSLRTGEMTIAWVLQFGRRGVQITPYIGVGGGFMWYTFEEAGSFIDFGDPELPIFNAAYRATGNEPMYFGLIGLDIPAGHTFGIVIEGRWKNAETVLGHDFSDLPGEFDLSGLELTAGFSWNF